VALLVAGRAVRVLSDIGELLCRFAIDPTRNCQRKVATCSPEGIRTRDLFLESDEVERSGLATHSLDFPDFATQQRT
jgi:hypothetical protein